MIEGGFLFVSNYNSYISTKMSICMSAKMTWFLDYLEQTCLGLYRLSIELFSFH